MDFNIFGGFHKKNEYFWGYEDFVDIFGGSSQNWTILCILGYRMGDIFLGLLKFQIFFLGCLKFLIFLGVNGRCLA